MSSETECTYDSDSLDEISNTVFVYESPSRPKNTVTDLPVSRVTKSIAKELPRKGPLSIESNDITSTSIGGGSKNMYVVEMEIAEAKKREVKCTSVLM